MADINQTNSKEKQVSEFENLLQVYTEHTLKEDSSLPPQTRVVKETLDSIKGILDAKDIELDERVSIVESKFDDLDTELTTKVNSNLDMITTSISTEADRAKLSEKELSDRIFHEKERIDAFLEGEDITDTAIDTLKEIQRWINDDETGTANLLIKVSHIENDIAAEVAARETAIGIEEQRAKAEELRLTDAIDKTNKAFRAECDILFNSLDTEVASRLSADEALQSKVNAEIARSSQKDNELEQALSTSISNLETIVDSKLNEEKLARETNVSAIINRLQGIETDLTTKISNEAVYRDQVDTELVERINAEISNRQEEVTELRNEIAKEVATTKDAEEKLKQLISKETSERINMDLAINARLDGEEETRATADAELDRRIAELEQEFIISCGNSDC